MGISGRLAFHELTMVNLARSFIILGTTFLVAAGPLYVRQKAIPSFSPDVHRAFIEKFGSSGFLMQGRGLTSRSRTG